MNPRYPAVASRAGHHCEYCHAPEAVFNLPFEVEHIVPPGKGGSDGLENLALACRACNLFKSDQTRCRDVETGMDVRLFHPRRDLWNDHFRMLDSGGIEGATEIGRATASALHINTDAQIRARAMWLRLALIRLET